jgi:pimeloyl-ACP methyl ester carboxylesterase
MLPAPAGHHVALHELGGSGRPVLFCHATGLHGAVWEPMAAGMGDGFARWSMDFRAHGASVVPAESTLTWDVFADDLEVVLDALADLGVRPGELLGVGHSMGGAALVLTEQRRPGTFAGLHLFEPIVIPPGSQLSGSPGMPNPLADGAERRRATFASRAEALENYASKRPLSGLRADALHAYVRHGFVDDVEGPGVHLACRPADEAAVFRGAPGNGAFEVLGQVACPVVVASGDEGFGPALFAPAVADALPHGELERFEHIGHFGPLEAPDHVAASVVAFAARL